MQPGEYVAFGLAADTADAWVNTASAMMEAHCRRPSLLTATYTERLRVGRRTQSVRLSYGPVQGVNAVRVRYGSSADGGGLADIAAVFGLPGQWTDIDSATTDVDLLTGEMRFAPGLFGLSVSEVEVTYTAGVEIVPDALKIACAQVVRNAQATPGLNVRSSRMDTLATEYFSDVLLDTQVRALLRPYVAERLS